MVLLQFRLSPSPSPFEPEKNQKTIAMKQVYVFKTSVKTDDEIRQARLLLDSFQSVIKVDFDPEDCDSILRIESTAPITHVVIELLTTNGFFCEELN